jgi:hypothetical protein
VTEVKYLRSTPFAFWIVVCLLFGGLAAAALVADDGTRPTPPAADAGTRLAGTLPSFIVAAGRDDTTAVVAYAALLSELAAASEGDRSEALTVAAALTEQLAGSVDPFERDQLLSRITRIVALVDTDPVAAAELARMRIEEPVVADDLREPAPLTPIEPALVPVTIGTLAPLPFPSVAAATLPPPVTLPTLSLPDVTFTATTATTAVATTAAPASTSTTSPATTTTTTTTATATTTTTTTATTTTTTTP